MATYGNSGGRNRGKKYKKDYGDTTPESENRARNFMDWYGNNFTALRDKLIYDQFYDDEVATDTALYIYDCIAYKGLTVDNYKWYYLRAYHTAFMAAQKNKKHLVSVDDEESVIQLPASDFDSDTYEEVVETINTEVLEYVRESYDEVAVSLFEIYVGLSPDISYKRMSNILGIPATKIWPVIGQIKKDLVKRFDDRRDFLLSGVVGF